MNVELDKIYPSNNGKFYLRVVECDRIARDLYYAPKRLLGSNLKLFELQTSHNGVSDWTGHVRASSQRDIADQMPAWLGRPEP
jgi:hypothetical protein